MIEINLLKQDALNVVAQELGEDLSSFVSNSALSSKKNKRLIILLGITLTAWVVIVIFLGPAFMRWMLKSQMAIPQTAKADVAEVLDSKPVSELKDVVRPEPVITINEENVVEEIVLGVRQNIERKKRVVIPELLDFEKIQYQKFMIYTGLKSIGDAASLKVTFGKLVLKLPGYYYLHGLASDNTHYMQFKKTLEQVSSEMSATPIKQVGYVGKTEEFTLSGSFKPLPWKETVVTFVEKSDIKKFNSELVDLAEHTNVSVLSLREKTPEAMHGYTSYSFSFSVASGYADIIKFVHKLHTNNFPVGILQMSVVPNEDQKMFSTFDLVYYSKN